MKQEFIELAGRIRELREVCGYSLERMAKEIGISPSILAGYEQNGEDIPISVIYEIANICKVEFTDILTGQKSRDTAHNENRYHYGYGTNKPCFPPYHIVSLYDMEKRLAHLLYCSFIFLSHCSHPPHLRILS